MNYTLNVVTFILFSLHIFNDFASEKLYLLTFPLPGTIPTLFKLKGIARLENLKIFVPENNTIKLSFEYRNIYVNHSINKMNHQLKSITWILFILLSTFSITSCDKDSNEPLSLDLIENNATKLHYGSNGGVTIIGGDGNYSFSCESSLLKAEMTYSNYISLEPLGVGDATVTIKDSSGESYLLKVTIAYKTINMVVTKLNTTVVGDNMTIVAQKELKEKAFTTIPVKVGGGYKFVYTEGEEQNVTNGTVFIYADKYGTDGIEGTFDRGLVKADDGSYSYTTYTLHYNDMNRTFIFMEYVELKNQTPEFRTIQFAENLKEQYKAEYPNVEQIYTSQILHLTVE